MLHVLERSITIPFISVGSNIQQVIEEKLIDTLEGRCTNEGYIKPNSIRIMTFSSGMMDGSDVTFHVIFECLVCNPVEGLRFGAVVKNITKAGIRAEYNTGSDEEESPVVVFISRDHHFNNKDFGKIDIGHNIQVQVVGTRYELNDTQISIIGQLVKKKNKSIKIQKKKSIKIKVPVKKD
jgi:DNA-directed RNA polymerase subunit E'/Rpb7